MSTDKFNRDLFEALKVKKTALDEQIALLEKERSEIRAGMQSVCAHDQIVEGTYYAGGDSYSQTYSEGTSYKCAACGLYEKGHGGTLYQLSWNRRCRS